MPHPWNVICKGDVTGHPCNGGNPIPLTREVYMRQLSNVDSLWKCPVCRGNAYWDEEGYELFVELDRDGGV